MRICAWGIFLLIAFTFTAYAGEVATDRTYTTQERDLLPDEYYREILKEDNPHATEEEIQKAMEERKTKRRGDIKTTDELKRLLEESRKAWEREKVKHDNSYSYKTSFVSWTGYRRVTSTKVKNGIVVGRESRENIPDKGSSSVIEGAGEIGTHKELGKAKTMEQHYADCANVYLAQNPSGGEIRLSLSKENILTECSYRPYKCADDCTRGMGKIENFEWE